MNQLDRPPHVHDSKIEQIGQAVFYCLNESSQKIPVSIVHDPHFSGKDIIEFTVSRIPMTEQDWNIFAGELFFYKKGIPFSYKLQGIANVKTMNPLTMQFKITQTEYTGQEDLNHSSVKEALTEFFNTTAVFLKKVLVTGF